MTSEQIFEQLQGIAADDEFAARSSELVAAWSSAGVGLEATEPILRFMEEHPTVEFGMPGTLVHFVERFYQKGYEAKLLESIERRPTAHTVWMLNRLINGAKSASTREQLIAVMEQAKNHPQSDAETVRRIARFLQRLSQ